MPLKETSHLQYVTLLIWPNSYGSVLVPLMASMVVVWQIWYQNMISTSVLIFIFIKYIFSFVSQHLTVLQLPWVIITHFHTAVCPEGQVNLCCVNASLSWLVSKKLWSWGFVIICLNLKVAADSLLYNKNTCKLSLACLEIRYLKTLCTKNNNTLKRLHTKIRSQFSKIQDKNPFVGPFPSPNNFKNLT